MLCAVGLRVATNSYTLAGMMYRFAGIVKQCNKVLGPLTNNSYLAIGRIVSPAGLISKAERYSTETTTSASELKKTLPKFWISKMKTAFACLDVDGDGNFTENDITHLEEEMRKYFPDMSEEHRDILAGNIRSTWNDIFGGRGKGADYKITEDMFIERMFYMATQEGCEEMFRLEWQKLFKVMDLNKDGLISKSEYGMFINSWKDPIGAMVGFTAIDENKDGVISREQFAKAGTEFFFNFTDESKPSKYMYGLLKF